MNTQNTTVKTAAQPLVWMVDLTVPSVELEAHDAVQLPARDRDGKFAPKFEKPVTKRQAMKKLEASSRKQAAAMDRLADMENW